MQSPGLVGGFLDQNGAFETGQAVCPGLSSRDDSSATLRPQRPRAFTQLFMKSVNEYLRSSSSAQAFSWV